jgi:chemotaxis protein methyltransferase CheR
MLAGRTTTRGAEPDTNTNTYFFREPEAINVVRDHVIVPRSSTGLPVSIWSVGCSTGDEPYSISIATCAASCTNIQILATDVRGDALEHAKRGRYAPRHLRHVSRGHQQRWFERSGGDFVVRREPRDPVSFQRHDVLRDAPLTPHASQSLWDVIFCRNVLVYYDQEHVKRALLSLASVMKPDGVLILSGAEWLNAELRSDLSRAGQLWLDETDGVLVYRRVTPVRALAPPLPRPRPSVELRSPAALPRRRADEIPATTPDPTPPSLKERGTRLLDSGKVEQALTVLLSAAQQDPLAADVHLYLGVCLLCLDQKGRALDALRRSLFVEPNLWPAAWLLGDLLQVEDAAAGARYFTQACDILEKPPKESPAALQDGGALEQFLPGRKVALEAARVRRAHLANPQRRRT